MLEERERERADRIKMNKTMGSSNGSWTRGTNGGCCEVKSPDQSGSKRKSNSASSRFRDTIRGSFGNVHRHAH